MVTTQVGTQVPIQNVETMGGSIKTTYKIWKNDQDNYT